jgi:Tfp pilus assembly protein PilO
MIMILFVYSKIPGISWITQWSNQEEEENKEEEENNEAKQYEIRHKVKTKLREDMQRIQSNYHLERRIFL